MSTFNQKLAQDQALAAQVQAGLRNGRRQVRPNQVATAMAIRSEEVDPGFDVEDLPPPPLAPEMLPVMCDPAAITLSPLDLPAEYFKNGLDRRKQNRELLLDWLRTALVEGVDFGRVHIVGKDRCDLVKQGRAKECNNPYHWSKPSLFKPGAEKITGMLGMTVHYPSLPAYEMALLSGTELKTILLRCELHDAQGRVVAEGVGARSLAEDYGDLNKALKMAEKSAHIDATLRLAGLSEVFTQDMEDRPTVEDAEPVSPKQPKSNPVSSRGSPRGDNGFVASTPPTPRVPRSNDFVPPPPSDIPPAQSRGIPQGRGSSASFASPVSLASHPTDDDTALITEDDVSIVQQRIVEVGIAEKRVMAWLNKVTRGAVTRLDQLNVAQSASLLKRLDLWAKELAEQAA